MQEFQKSRQNLYQQVFGKIDSNEKFTSQLNIYKDKQVSKGVTPMLSKYGKILSVKQECFSKKKNSTIQKKPQMISIDQSKTSKDILIEKLTKQLDVLDPGSQKAFYVRQELGNLQLNPYQISNDASYMASGVVPES